MEERYTGGEEAVGISEQRHAKGWQEADSLGFRRGHQADFADGNETAGAASDQVRIEAQVQERDARAQGQHPEIYGRRLSRLGLRPGAGRDPRADGYRARKLDPG